MADRARIDELAASIADGLAVDWQVAEDTAASDADRALIERLKHIDRLVGARRSHGAPPSSTPVAPSVGTQPAPETGQRWGHLTIVRKIGEGAFGEVFLAHDSRLARNVALKLLRTLTSAGSSASAAIEEGRLLALVRHPNVVTVYGADAIDGRVGVWMEFITGRTLEDVLREQGRFGAHEAALIGVDSARALAAVHRAGLVHRDIKAQNVMREDGGRLVLMDFGTGRERGRLDGAVANLTGTPLYLAPEVLRGEAATTRSDIYGLGVLLYHLVTGAYPIAAETIRDVIAAHDTGTHTRLQDARPDLPAAFIRIVERAMAAEPDRRFGTAGEMESALAEMLAGGSERDSARDLARATSLPTAATGSTGRIRQWVLAHPGSATAATIATLALVATVTIWRPGPAPIAVPPPAERDLILVSSFDNRTDDTWLGDAVSRWLEHELTSLAVASVVSPERASSVLRHLTKEPVTVVSADVGRQIGEHDAGIRRRIAGVIVRAGPGYRLNASIFDAKGGRLLTTVTASAAAATQLPGAIRILAGQIREALGEARADIAKSDRELAGVTAPALEAFHLYSQSFVHREPQDWNESLQHVDRSLEIDPDFAAAHAWKARALAQLGRPRTEWQREAERATALRNTTASMWERHWIDGSVAQLNGEFDKALAEFATVLEMDPTHDWAATELVTLARQLYEPVQSARYLIQAADARPFDGATVAAAQNAAMAAALWQHAEHNAARVRAIVSADGWFETASKAWTVEPWSAWLQGNMADAARRLDHAVTVIKDTTDPERSRVAADLVHMYLAIGHTRDAETAARLVTQPQSRAYLLGLAAYWRDDDAALKAALPQHLILTTPDFEPPQNPELWTLMLLKAGRLADAGHIVEGRTSFASYPLVLRARLLAAQGDWQGALDQLNQAPAKPEGSPFYLWDRQDILAEVLMQLNQRDRAADTLRAATWKPNDVNAAYYSAPLGLRNLAKLADLDRALGQSPDAESIRRELRRLLADADPDFAPARQAVVPTRGR